MEVLLNESILDMVNDGRLSMKRIHDLIYIRGLINRVASKSYVDEETVVELEKKYGVCPSIITWGDYFQTEMAVSLSGLSDDGFDRAVDTLKFDLIASYTIFNEKERSFFEWVDLMYEAVMDQKESDLTQEEKEIIHLKILMDYYMNVGIIDGFTESEKHWFDRFQEAKAQ
jgi:hypothetical protein